MREVTRTTLFINTGREIDPEGLYSQEIFGTVGTSERMNTMAYTSLYADLLHPRLYEYIVSLSSIYKKIMAGTAYAKFDATLGDFAPSDIVNGETGYDFFMSHIHEVKFKETKSKRRQNKIDVLYKHIKSGEYTNNKLLILPAGLRDFNVEKSGSIKEDEINDLYRDVINSSNLMSNFIGADGAGSFKFKLQEKMNTLYKHVLTLIDGKKKLIQGEWASRAVEYRSRTVAVGTEDLVYDLDDDYNITDMAKAGLALYAKSIDPIAKYHLNEAFLRHVFGDVGDRAVLIDPDTLDAVQVDLPAVVIDKWRTNDGLDHIMNTLLDNDVKNEPVMVGDNYLFTLIDRDDTIIKYDDQFSIPDSDKSFRRPITYGELFYIALLPVIGELPGFITRYPMTDQGSIIPVLVDVFTTTTTRHMTVETVGDANSERDVRNYPILDIPWINGLKAPYVRTDGLGLDFDGDQILLMMVMLSDSIEEVKKLLDTPAPYIGADGIPMLSEDDKVLDNVLKFMTSRKIKG